MTSLRHERRLLIKGAAALACGAWRPTLAAAPVCAPRWPQWDAFVRRHVQDDGRVVDFSVPEQHSTSESQSYAMLFALVANERARFDTLWRWSRDNLGAGSDRLPAWHWGRRENGSFGVLDPNSAADADLWFAYALLEAGRLWQQPAYHHAAVALLAQVRQREVKIMPKLGPMLLPGEVGFETGAQRWRLNPSYLPLPLLRRFAALDPAGPWNAMAQASAQLVTQASPQGFAPDWVVYDAAKGVLPDSERSVVGSYDAIRVYLWAGVTADGDPLVAGMRNALAPMVRAVRNYGAPPEKIDTVSGAPSGRGPIGFSAALLPYLKVMQADDALAAQQRLVGDKWAAWQAGAPQPGAAGDGDFNYYNSMLTLFGWGWLQGHYRFDANGQLDLAWRCN